MRPPLNAQENYQTQDLSAPVRARRAISEIDSSLPEWQTLQAGTVLDDAALKRLFHDLDLRYYGATTEQAQQQAELLRLYAVQKQAENMVTQAKRDQDGNILLSGVPVREEDALYFAKLDAQHFQDTDTHLRPDQLETAIRIRRRSGRYTRRLPSQKIKLSEPEIKSIRVPIVERLRQARTTGGSYKAFARIGLQLEKTLSKNYPNSRNINWRGYFANVAEQNAGKITQYGQKPLTRAGNALMKHGNRVNTVYPRPSGINQEMNQQAQAIVEDILYDEATTLPAKYINPMPKRYPNAKYLIDLFSDWGEGPGLRYQVTPSGKLEFVGFLEPKW